MEAQLLLSCARVLFNTLARSLTQRKDLISLFRPVASLELTASNLCVWLSLLFRVVFLGGRLMLSPTGMVLVQRPRQGIKCRFFHSKPKPFYSMISHVNTFWEYFKLRNNEIYQPHPIITAFDPFYHLHLRIVAFTPSLPASNIIYNPKNLPFMTNTKNSCSKALCFRAPPAVSTPERDPKTEKNSKFSSSLLKNLKPGVHSVDTTTDSTNKKKRDGVSQATTTPFPNDTMLLSGASQATSSKGSKQKIKQPLTASTEGPTTKPLLGGRGDSDTIKTNFSTTISNKEANNSISVGSFLDWQSTKCQSPVFGLLGLGNSNIHPYGSPPILMNINS